MGSIEVNLRCGDTISVPSMPAIGAYRHCEHCDGRRMVIGVPVITACPKPPLSIGDYQDVRKRISDEYVYGDISLPVFEWQWQVVCAIIDRELDAIHSAFWR
jgi:hypothetical protein